MNSLIVYDSQFGNTEKIARSIGKTLAEFGSAQVEHVADVTAAEFDKLDLLVIGSPTQGWRATPAMRAFQSRLTPEEVGGVVVACFDTRFHRSRWLTGSAARRLAKQMSRLGFSLEMAPESFFVTATEGPLEEGELDRAAIWARTIHDEIEHKDTTPKVTLKQ